MLVPVLAGGGIAIVIWFVGRMIAGRLPGQIQELVKQLIPVLVLTVLVVTLLVVIDPDQAQTLMDSSISSIPRIVIAVIIVIIARALGRILGLFVETALRSVSDVMAVRGRLVVASAVLAIGVIIALQQLGISTDIILVLVAAFTFGTALTLAFAIGLGARPIARQIAAGRHVQNTYEAGQRVRFGDLEGTITEIKLATTSITVGDEVVNVPNEELLTNQVTLLG
ncbi:MAG: mechanosensitive ion channel [Acidimicrobiia bacterium]|nr:mechanosensitive ion channel [Acidimicrobiia bacterium]NNF69032.1 mechanosensitive ion channel [Acidimicrobiia bacterium]